MIASLPEVASLRPVRILRLSAVWLRKLISSRRLRGLLMPEEAAVLDFELPSSSSSLLERRLVILRFLVVLKSLRSSIL